MPPEKAWNPKLPLIFSATLGLKHQKTAAAKSVFKARVKHKRKGLNFWVFYSEILDFVF